MVRFRSSRILRVAVACALAVLAALPLAAARQSAPAQPTFLIYKYQHIVGDETDTCQDLQDGATCRAEFHLRFTGSTISLTADLRVGPGGEPRSYTAHGQNSTRSFIDLDVTVAGSQVRIGDNGTTRTVPLSGPFFTLEQDVPFGTQERLFAYWHAQHEPARLALLPAGEVRIRRRGTLVVPSSKPETLTRYSIHGVTWGDEAVWLTAGGQIAAIVGSDAEEDRMEALRPPYAAWIKDFAVQAAADAVADLEAARTRPEAKPVATGTYALTHATVINPADGRRLTDATVVVRDGRIAAVGSALPVPPGVPAIDAAGTFVLPGLWDTHGHSEQWEWGPADLAAGVTTVRDVGNEIEFLVPIRRSLNADRGLGPHWYAAGLIDSDPGSLTSEHAEDAETARRIVDRYHDLGYEEMKIYQSLRPELIAVVATEAHRLGMQVTGHIPTGATALEGVRDGMDQINHIGFATRVMRPTGATDVRAEYPEAQAAIRLFLDHHTVIEPTLARGEFNGHPRRVPFAEIDPAAAWLPPELAVILNQAGVPADREARSAASLKTALETTRILHEAGVPILAGTDQVIPGASLHRELALLVQAGLSPMDALRSATSVPAHMLGIPDVGSIVPGARADLVVLDADPTADIKNIRRVRWTILGGTIFRSSALWGLVDIHPPARPAASF